jgi:pSer/pThr/pTyr-binding forkhead associated (FHA) protein
VTESKISTPTGNVHATLVGLSGKYSGKTFHFVNDATIGKSGTNTILLDEGIVSPNHARLFYDSRSDEFVIEDLGSRTGILVDGIFVDDRAVVGENQVITIANQFSFKLLIEDGSTWHEPSSESGEGPEVSVNNLEAGRDDRDDENVDAKSDESEPLFYLDLTDSISPESRYNLVEGINLIGRDATNHIVLQDNSVSRHHAVILVNGVNVTVRDLDSKNHTFVNGEMIESEVMLSLGTQLMIGLMSFEVCGAEQMPGNES